MCKTADKHLHHSSWTPHHTTFTANGRTGRCAENLTVYYLRNRGFTILARNYETSRGEIDIIAGKMDADIRGYPTVVFVEVKSRSHTKGLAPETNVTVSKQRKITATMRQWMGKHARLRAVYRCDIAAIIVPKKSMPRIRYYPNAFHMKEAFGW